MTTMTSYTILTTVANIFSMIFSIIILKTKYLYQHYLGSSIAIVSLFFAVYYDLPDDSNNPTLKKQIFGDISIFFGEICVAL